MVSFFRKAIAFTRKYTILQRRKFFVGKDTDQDANAVPDIQWFGEDLGPPRWDDPEARILCSLLDGSEEPSEAGPYFLFLALNGDYRRRDDDTAAPIGVPVAARDRHEPPGGRRIRG
jgi:pullulanase/glycogen debranching enzyme